MLPGTGKPRQRNHQHGKEFIMTKTSIATIALTLAAAFAGQAMAQDTAVAAKAAEKPANAAKASTDAKTTTSADPYAELDKVKKW
jgi:hypothetical protein